MNNTVPTWFVLISIAFVAIFFFLFIIGSRQEKVLVERAKSWPTVESVVVERLFLSADPTTYRYRVKYVFKNIEYISVAQNFYHKSNENKYVGDVIKIKIDPDNPEMSVLYS